MSYEDDFEEFEDFEDEDDLDRQAFWQMVEELDVPQDNIMLYSLMLPFDAVQLSQSELKRLKQDPYGLINDVAEDADWSHKLGFALLEQFDDIRTVLDIIHVLGDGSNRDAQAMKSWLNENDFDLSTPEGQAAFKLKFA